MKNRLSSRRPSSSQRAFTLVEILVALTVGLIVTAAGVAALLVGRQGFTSTDNSAQLRENARFAANLIQRITRQSGFADIAVGSVLPPAGYPGPTDRGYLRGYDNSIVGTTGDDSGLAHSTRNGCTVTDTSCLNGSDVLVIRYQGASVVGGVSDNSMIDCAGQPEPAPTPAKPFGISIFNVKRSQSGEPTLVCTYQDAMLNWIDVPLVQGVEAFRVLYGTDGVTANLDSGDPNAAAIAAVLTATPDPNSDTIPDRYLRAVDLDVAGAFNRNNWTRVRTLRIGLLLRGPANSAVDRAGTARSYDLLGGSFVSATDTHQTLTIPVADGRLRQQFIFTVHLRNPQITSP